MDVRWLFVSCFNIYRYMVYGSYVYIIYQCSYIYIFLHMHITEQHIEYYSHDSDSSHICIIICISLDVNAVLHAWSYMHILILANWQTFIQFIYHMHVWLLPQH